MPGDLLVHDSGDEIVLGQRYGQVVALENVELERHHSVHQFLVLYPLGHRHQTQTVGQFPDGTDDGLVGR